MLVAVRFDRRSIPAGIDRQNDIGSPKIRASTPARRRYAVAASPYGPAPTTATSVIERLPSRKGSVRTPRVPPCGRARAPDRSTDPRPLALGEDDVERHQAGLEAEDEPSPLGDRRRALAHQRSHGGDVLLGRLERRERRSEPLVHATDRRAGIPRRLLELARDQAVRDGNEQPME